MKHGRTAGGETGAVHALSTAMFSQRGPYGALCSIIPTGAPDVPHKRFTGRWHRTEEPVSCQRCLGRLERLAEQALWDEQAIGLLSQASAQADGDRVRAFRRSWPAMGRAIADLLRYRGIRLGEGWTGPARESVPR